MGRCIDIYDMYDSMAQKSLLLVKNQASQTMGGSLTQPLTCSDELPKIKTPYSEKLLLLTNGMQYVELITSKDQSSQITFRVRIFLPFEDFEVLKDIVDVNDNENNQCK